MLDRATVDPIGSVSRLGIAAQHGRRDGSSWSGPCDHFGTVTESQLEVSAANVRDGLSANVVGVGGRFGFWDVQSEVTPVLEGVRLRSHSSSVHLQLKTGPLVKTTGTQEGVPAGQTP